MYSRSKEGAGADQKLFRIDGTDIPVDQRDDDVSWNDDHSEDEYYYGYDCCVVTAANNIPVAATFTTAKKVDQEMAMRITRDALAVEIPRWMLDDQSSIYWSETTTCWSSGRAGCTVQSTQY